MTDTTHTGPELPPAFEFVYEWDNGNCVKRKLDSNRWNGRKCDRAYLVYTADQLRVALTERDAARKEEDELQRERDLARENYAAACSCLARANVELAAMTRERDEWIEKYKAQGQRADDRIGELMAERDQLRAELEAIRAAKPVALTEPGEVVSQPGAALKVTRHPLTAAGRAMLTAAQPEGETR